MLKMFSIPRLVLMRKKVKLLKGISALMETSALVSKELVTTTGQPIPELLKVVEMCRLIPSDMASRNC